MEKKVFFQEFSRNPPPPGHFELFLVELLLDRDVSSLHDLMPEIATRKKHIKTLKVYTGS